MKIFKSFWMSFSMFCALPCPFFVWEDGLRPMMTGMLGLVGTCLGMLWVGVAMLCVQLQLPTLLSAALLTITPWLLSGFIHLDGFMDCCDASLSRRDLKERQRILKDSTCGAFSVIAFVCLALVSFGAVASWTGSAPWTLVFIATAPRCLSAFGVLTLRPMCSSQYVQVRQNGGVLAIIFVTLALCLVLAFFYEPKALFCTLASMLGWVIACWQGYRSLDGMSGDISGYALTIGECCGLVALAIL